MDLETGIYPYTDSFTTTTGSVCTGLGIPEESIETTIGAFSVISILDKAFVQHMKTFPTKIENPQIGVALNERYKISQDEFVFGWTDLNLVHNAERINKLDSLFLTHLDLLDDLDEIRVCTGYKNKRGDLLPKG